MRYLSSPIEEFHAKKHEKSDSASGWRLLSSIAIKRAISGTCGVFYVVLFFPLLLSRENVFALKIWGKYQVLFAKFTTR